MRTKCGHDRPSWHYLGVPVTIRRWIWTNIGTNVGMIAQAGTFSAYLSLSEGGFGQTLERMWARSSKSALSRRTVHYPRVGFGQTLAKLTLCGGGIGPIWATWAVSGVKLGQNGAKRALLGVDFGSTLCKVGIIWANIGPSGHYRGWMWSKGGFGHTIE